MASGAFVTKMGRQSNGFGCEFDGDSSVDDIGISSPNVLSCALTALVLFS